MEALVQKLMSGAAATAAIIFLLCVLAGLAAWLLDVQVHLPGVASIFVGQKNQLPAVYVTPNGTGMLSWIVVVSLMYAVGTGRTNRRRPKAHSAS